MSNEQKIIQQEFGLAEKQLRLLLSRIDKTLFNGLSSSLPFKKTVHWLKRLPLQSTATQALATTFAKLHNDSRILDESAKKKFVQNLIDSMHALQGFDQHFSGGLSGYIETANSLAKKVSDRERKNTDSHATQKLYRYSPSPLCDLRSATLKRRKRLLGVAMPLLETTAIVLVAGGIGERLGYGESKLKIPLEPMGKASFMEHFADAHYSLRKLAAIEKIKAKQKDLQRNFPNDNLRLSQEVSDEITKTRLPLVIVASDANIDSTQKFLNENDFFGIPLADICILQQPSLPCLVDNRGTLAFKDDGVLMCKPGGHGSVHRLLADSGVLNWFSQRGVSHVVFLQDTNAQVLRSLPLLLGLSEDFQVSDDVQSTAVDFLLVGVPQVENQPMGVLATRESDREIETHAKNQTDKESISSTCVSNVEYHLLQREAKNFAGDIRHYPANTNTIIARFAAYKDTVDRFGHSLPYHFNPKFSKSVDKTAKTFQQFSNPTRLEQLMQDLSLLYKNPNGAAVALLDRCDAFAAMKTPMLNHSANTNSDQFLNGSDQKKNSQVKFSATPAFSNPITPTDFRLDDSLNTLECELQYFSSVKQRLQIYKNNFLEIKTETDRKNLLFEMEKSSDKVREIVLNFFSWKAYRSFARVVLPQYCLMDEAALSALYGNTFSPYATLVVQGRGELSLQGMVMEPFSAMTISLGQGVQLVCENARVSGIGYRLQMAKALSAQLEKHLETKDVFRQESNNTEDIQTSAWEKPFSKLETLRGYRIIRLGWQTIEIKTPGRYRLFDRKGKVFTQRFA